MDEKQPPAWNTRERQHKTHAGWLGSGYGQPAGLTPHSPSGGKPGQVLTVGQPPEAAHKGSGHDDDDDENKEEVEAGRQGGAA